MDIKYREPSNLNELESLFRLRYIVYSEDRFLNKMVCPSSTHDINYFDLNALHYGAFDGENPIAYIRITTSTKTHFTNWVENILELNNITIESNFRSFPFQSYYPDINWSLSFVDGLKGKKIGEVGKLAIHKDYRKRGIVLEGLIHSFIHYCKKEQKINTGFGSCTLQLERYYRKFGFTRAQGSIPFVHKELPEAVIVRFDSN